METIITDIGTSWLATWIGNTSHIIINHWDHSPKHFHIADMFITKGII
jgi:hypothetical protein